jgi:hypothetical protein
MRFRNWAHLLTCIYLHTDENGRSSVTFNPIIFRFTLIKVICHLVVEACWLRSHMTLKLTLTSTYLYTVQTSR